MLTQSPLPRSCAVAASCAGRGTRRPEQHTMPKRNTFRAAASTATRPAPDAPVRPDVTRRLRSADNGSVRLRSVLARPFRYPVRWRAFLAGGVPAVLVFPGPSLSYLAWFALVPGMVLFP